MVEAIPSHTAVFTFRSCHLLSPKEKSRSWQMMPRWQLILDVLYETSGRLLKRLPQADLVVFMKVMATHCPAELPPCPFIIKIVKLKKTNNN
jgi:hypothetical protein